jgi:hypothetical protein
MCDIKYNNFSSSITSNTKSFFQHITYKFSSSKSFSSDLILQFFLKLREQM